MDTAHLVRKGRQALARGNALDEAEAAFRSALNANPENRDAVLGLAVSLRGARRLDEAAQLLDRWLDNHAEDAAAHCHAGLVSHLQARPLDAARHLCLSLTLDPKSAYALDALRRIELEQLDRGSDWPEDAVPAFTALSAAEELLRGNVTDPDAMILLATALRGCRRLDKAAALLKGWIARQPDDADACTQLGLTLYRDGAAGDGLAILLRAVALAPDRGKAVAVFRRVAFAAAAQPDIPERVEALLSRRPLPELVDFPRQLFIAAGTMATADEPEQARRLFEEGRRLDPGNPVCDWHLFNLRPLPRHDLAESLIALLPADMRLVVVDVGARGGAELSGWSPVLSRVDLHGFEPDEQACRDLEATIPNDGARYRYHPVALDRQAMSGRDLYLTRNRWCSSFYPPNHPILRRLKQYGRDGQLGDLDQEFVVEETANPVTTTLDAFWTEASPGDLDFIKLDVQGAELDILEGGTVALGRTSGLLVEVEFIALYEGQPLFADVDRFLRRQGFHFFSFLFTHTGHFAGRRRSPVTCEEPASHRFARQVGGQWVSADALYLRDPITDGIKPESAGELWRWVRLAILADLHEQTEFAFEVAGWAAEHAHRLGLPEAAALSDLIQA
ncbi:hypothetical protein [Azospirillum melinis]